MKVVVCANQEELGSRAATEGAEQIRQAIAKNGQAAIIVATGASQFATLQALVDQPDIDWGRVTGFHLDEYINMAATHPASFRKYLKERFVDLVPLKAFHYIDAEAGDTEAGDDDGAVQAECDRLGEIIGAQPIDVAFVGIGENGHLAFNDPPADFETSAPYLIVGLDEACRKQQLGEGWFDTLDDVPRQAISMSIRQIMKSRHIVCSVPDERKAQAVKMSVEGPVTNTAPASILQEHGSMTLLLDPQSAALIQQPT